MVIYILQTITLLLPLFVSGLLLIYILKKGSFLKLAYPVDFYKTIRGQRLIGDSKTFRGIIVHIIGCIIVCTILYIILKNYNIRYIHRLFTNNPFLLGSIGEIINSFIKRRLNIKPGGITKSRLYILQYIADRGDGIVLVSIVLFLIFHISLNFPFVQLITVIILGIVLHFGTDILMKYLRLK